MKVKLEVSPTCTAFSERSVGTKVLISKAVFLELLATVVEGAIKEDRFPKNGQSFLDLPPQITVESILRCGVAKMETVRRCAIPIPGSYSMAAAYNLKENMHVVEWRGIPGVYAHPRTAAKTEFAAAVIYSREAYNADPDVQREDRAVTEEYTHVLVALIGTAGPKAPYSHQALVHNIAGGNTAFLPQDSVEKDMALLNKIINYAKDTEAYAKEWMVVADPVT